MRRIVLRTIECVLSSPAKTSAHKFGQALPQILDGPGGLTSPVRRAVGARTVKADREVGRFSAHSRADSFETVSVVTHSRRTALVTGCVVPGTLPDRPSGDLLVRGGRGLGFTEVVPAPQPR